MNPIYLTTLSLYSIGSTAVVMYLGFKLTRLTEGPGFALLSLVITFMLMMIGAYICLSLAAILECTGVV